MTSADASSTAHRAFVLGGGGKWGAVEVGMLLALAERGIVPDVVVGCSIGAINGAAYAADPTVAGVRRLQRFWEHEATDLVNDASWRDRARAMVGRRAHLFDTDRLRAGVARMVPVSFDDLRIPFQCVAASIERAAEHWFTDGPLVDALMASASIPGLFPPTRVGDEHFYDGGLVDSIPLDRAVELGATEIYVLQVGRVEQQLAPPERLYQALLVAFEIARRHRFASERFAAEHATVHLLPSGHTLAMDDRRQLAWRRTDDAAELLERAHVASAAYLDERVAT
jgi:NTE family protein